MALHCPATLFLVSTAGTVQHLEPGPAASYGPWGAGGPDVVEEIQSVADQHRGERVLVTLEPDALAVVLGHLGRRSGPGDGDSLGLRLEVGDDGWTVAPWTSR